MLILFVGLGFVAGLYVLGNIQDERRAKKASQEARERSALFEKEKAEKLKNLRVDYVDVEKCGLLISIKWSKSGALFYNLEGKRVSDIPRSKRELAKHFDCYLGQLLDSGKWEPVRRSDVEPRLQDAQFIKKHVCDLISSDEVRKRQAAKRGAKAQAKRKREGNHNFLISATSSELHAIHPEAVLNISRVRDIPVFEKERLRITYTVVDGVLDGTFTVTHEELGFVLLSAHFVRGEIHGQAERRGWDFKLEKHGPLRSRWLSQSKRKPSEKIVLESRLNFRESYVGGCLVSRMQPHWILLKRGTGVWSYEFLQEDRVAGEIAQRIESFMRGDKKAFTMNRKLDLSQAVRSTRLGDIASE